MFLCSPPVIRDALAGGRLFVTVQSRYEVRYEVLCEVLYEVLYEVLCEVLYEVLCEVLYGAALLWRHNDRIGSSSKSSTMEDASGK